MTPTSLLHQIQQLRSREYFANIKHRIWRAPSPRATTKDASKPSDTYAASRSPIRRNRPSLARSRGTNRRTLPPLDQVSGLGPNSPQILRVLSPVPPVPPIDVSLLTTLDERGQSEQSRIRRGERRGNLVRNTTVPTLLSEPSRYSSLNPSADESSRPRSSTTTWSSRPAPLTQNFAPALYAQVQGSQSNSRDGNHLSGHHDTESGRSRRRRLRLPHTRQRSTRVDATNLRANEHGGRSSGDEHYLQSTRRAGSMPVESWTFSNGNVDGLGDRERSFSPDNWDTMLSTIAPDRNLPTADSSFTSAVASASFSASDSQVNSQVNSRSSSASSSRTHLTIPSSRQTPVGVSVLPCITAESPGSETEADDDNFNINNENHADDHAESMDLDPDRTPQLGAGRSGVFRRPPRTPAADNHQYHRRNPDLPRDGNNNNNNNRRRSRSPPYLLPSSLPELPPRPPRSTSQPVPRSNALQQQRQHLQAVRPQSGFHSNMSIAASPAATDPTVPRPVAPPAPSSPFNLPLTNDEDANADMYAAINEHNNNSRTIIENHGDSSESEYYNSDTDDDDDDEEDDDIDEISDISIDMENNDDNNNNNSSSHLDISTTTPPVSDPNRRLPLPTSSNIANNNNNNVPVQRSSSNTSTSLSQRHHSHSQRDPFLEWAAGEASTQLERLRRIIDELAHRDDIPDEWWMSIGLTRGINMDLNTV